MNLRRVLPFAGTLSVLNALRTRAFGLTSDVRPYIDKCRCTEEVEELAQQPA